MSNEKKKGKKLTNPYELDYNSKTVKVLERKEKELNLFFSDVPSFENICATKRYLHTVTIIGQPRITSLNGISKLIHLRELWVVECLVKDISDLQSCCKLQKLYLYSNLINEVPNMANSPDLKLLSLSGNNISKLQNFHTMPKLEELYLAKNDIKIIEDSFSCNVNLSLINLAGNPLYKLKDIKNLSFLPSLSSIIFADPMYGECALVSLYNYRLFVINYLPHLTKLDYYPIFIEERCYVTEFFRSKVMFYNMLLHKSLSYFTKSIKDHIEENRQRISMCREKLYSAKLEQLRIATSADVGIRSNELLLHQTLQKIYSHVDVNDSHQEQWINDAQLNLQIMQRQLSLKMQHYGNMNFIECTLNAENTLAIVCQNICNDSLCPTIKQALRITGVTVHRVTTVINNETDVLRSYKYFKKCEKDEEQLEPIFTFLVKPVGIVDLKNWPFDIFEKEFFDTTEVIISDCLANADSDWLKNISSKQNSSTVPLHSVSDHRLVVLIQLPASTLTTKVEKCDDHNGTHCQCSSVVNPEQAKPVFVIEYEYIFQNRPQEDALEKLCSKVPQKNLSNAFHSTWVHFSYENLMCCLNLTELELHKLQVIDLSGQGLRSFELMIPLPNLRDLNLSFNKLTVLPDSIVLKHLRKLDISFNEICSFEMAALLPFLESLNLAWNKVNNFLTTLKMFETFTPHLITLNVKYNPFTDVTKVESICMLTSMALPSLKYFNEETLQNFTYMKPVNPNPWIIDIFETAELAKFKISKHAMASFISEANKSLILPLSIDEKQLKNVKYVNLSNNYLNNFEFIQDFHQLEELYLANNLLTLILLDKPMNYLTKLNLCDNFIMTMDGLIQKNLPVLKYLDLCNNLITSLMAMGTFHTLIEFYCSNNRISKLPEIYNLKNWLGLKVIDISNNPVNSTSLCKSFIIFHISKIEYIDGQCVTPADITEANHTFGGSLDKDTIMNMQNVGNLMCLRQLSIVNCAIKKVDFSESLLPNLESLDLHKNQITTLWGLHSLKKLQTLCLSYNQVETSMPKYRKDFILCECLFPNLNVLFLDHNGIRSLVDFNFQNMPKLKYLYLQHNNLHDVNGVQNCANLETLVLDHNKIQMITEEDFHRENNIRILCLENNKIKFLSFAKRLSKIQKLFISNNKVADKEQLKYLGTLEQLKETTILGNPLCKKTNHYKLAVQALSTLKQIDGHSVMLNEYSVDQ